MSDMLRRIGAGANSDCGYIIFNHIFNRSIRRNIASCKCILFSFFEECNHSFCIFCIVKVVEEQPSFNCPYCQRKILTKRLKLNGVKTGPKVDSPWGQTYSQSKNGELGVASYHFIDEETVYISYNRKSFLQENIY